MSEYSKLKELAEAANAVKSDVNITMAVGTTQEEVKAVQDFLQLAMPKTILALIAENERLERKNANQSKSIREYQDLVMGGDVSLGMLKADIRVTTGERDQLRAEVAGLKTGYEAYEQVVQGLKAENEEFKAVAAQPGSLNASPAAEYEALKRQFFALRNYALCKDKLSGYYSRELEKLRGVDRSQSAGEIDAERDINEQLTNDLLAAEAKIEALRKDAERLDFIESQNHKTLRFHKKKWSFEGFTNYEYSVFRSLREAIDAAMGKESCQ